MPKWGPVSRRTLVSSLKRLGFAGPYSGGRHQFMARLTLILTIPNPHTRDIGVGLLAVILRQAGITRAEWEDA
jgi:predicted RNA binding protein YcfA (HicA-like mRNA interferase family)